MDPLYAILAWLLPLPCLLLLTWYLTRTRKGTAIEKVLSIPKLVGPRWLSAFLCLLFVGGWLLPWGPAPWLVMGSVVLIWLPFDEIDGSQKIRTAMVSTAIASLLLSGFIPVSQPLGPSAWGEPLLSDNPNAPFYPNSEQLVWVLTQPELAAVSITTVRTPWTANPFAGEMAIQFMIEVTGADKTRMHASIEGLNERSSKVYINPDIFELVDIDSEDTHRYKRGDIDQTMTVKRQQIVLDIELPLITLKAEVLTVMEADWGGEAMLLTIIRPGLSEIHDVWAEDIVLEWLESRAE